MKLTYDLVAVGRHDGIGFTRSDELQQEWNCSTEIQIMISQE